MKIKQASLREAVKRALHALIVDAKERHFEKYCKGRIRSFQLLFAQEKWNFIQPFKKKFFFMLNVIAEEGWKKSKFVSENVKWSDKISTALRK